jgi:hypothetical protein
LMVASYAKMQQEIHTGQIQLTVEHTKI